MEKTYTFDISEFKSESTTGKARCTAVEQEDGVECDMTLDLDTSGLSAHDVRSVKKALRTRFEDDVESEMGRGIQIRWVGDKKATLLCLQKGDKVRFKGGEGEVIYVIPDKCGIRTNDGRILNFDFKVLEHFLFKKI